MRRAALSTLLQALCLSTAAFSAQLKILSIEGSTLQRVDLGKWVPLEKSSLLGQGTIVRLPVESHLTGILSDNGTDQKIELFGPALFRVEH